VPEQAPPRTKRVRYLYLDVVEFTRNRSVEAQSDIVGALNGIVGEAVSDVSLDTDDVLYLPTGDGLCIAMLDESAPFDIHIQLALRILAEVNAHNERTENRMRRFDVRVGANENVDNVIIDINGNTNVAGAGINMAQRVMSLADGRQLLVGQMVFETLTYRERYMNAFRAYEARIKHGVVIRVHQFIEDGHDGLSSEPPTAFSPPIPENRRFTELEAYYIGLAMKHREFLLHNSSHGQGRYALVVLLWFLAQDAVAARHSTDYDPATTKTIGGGEASFDGAFHHYMSLDFWVCNELSRFVTEKLSRLAPFLESAGPAYYFPNENGKEKLRQDHPDIFEALELDSSA
jgi:class 3 adenylate cyclase